MLKFEVIGNLGADAEIKDVQGSKFVTMRIAHSEKWTDAQGNEQHRTTWVDATMNDTESKIIPYLKQGVKVFVRGNGSLRVYSSPKDRMMKAGAQVRVQEIELVGGASEEIPRSLIDPSNGQIFDTEKFYWINRDNKEMKKDDLYTLVDARGREYLMRKDGFVAPKPLQESDANQNETQTT
jgi:single-strand DNA-binding protein